MQSLTSRGNRPRSSQNCTMRLGGVAGMARCAAGARTCSLERCTNSRTKLERARSSFPRGSFSLDSCTFMWLFIVWVASTGERPRSGSAGLKANFAGVRHVARKYRARLQRLVRLFRFTANREIGSGSSLLFTANREPVLLARFESRRIRSYPGPGLPARVPRQGRRGRPRVVRVAAAAAVSLPSQSPTGDVRGFTFRPKPGARSRILLTPSSRLSNHGMYPDP